MVRLHHKAGKVPEGIQSLVKILDHALRRTERPLILAKYLPVLRLYAGWRAVEPVLNGVDHEAGPRIAGSVRLDCRRACKGERQAQIHKAAQAHPYPIGLQGVEDRVVSCC